MKPHWTITLIGIVGTVAAMTAKATVATALTQVSNLAETNDVDFSAMPPPSPSTASSFTTDAGSYTLDSLSLVIHSNAPGSVEVRLRANSIDRPGALIQSLGSKVLAAGTTIQTFVSTGVILAPNTTYWVTAGEVGSGSVTWSGTFSTNQVSAGGWTIGDQCFSTTNGLTWLPISAGPPNEAGLFSVHATATGYVTNLNERTNFSYFMFPMDVRIASSFTTDAGSYSLRNLVLEIRSDFESRLGIQVRTDNAGHPGALLEDLGVNPLPGGTGWIRSSFLSLGSALSPNTKY